MNRHVQPPTGVGPHEGRELDLMLARQKPLALFSDSMPASFDWGEETFTPYVESGQLIKKEFILTARTANIQLRYVLFALHGEERRIDELQQIIKAQQPFNRQDEIKTGRLLGYTEDEIQAYLDWVETVRARD